MIWRGKSNFLCKAINRILSRFQALYFSLLGPGKRLDFPPNTVKITADVKRMVFDFFNLVHFGWVELTMRKNSSSHIPLSCIST